MTIARAGVIAGGAPSGVLPFFKAPFTSSITPSVGTAGTYIRAGTAYYPASPSTVSSKGANVACVPAYIPGLAGSAGGVQILNGAKNFILYSEDFTNAAWVAVGGGSTASNTATAPDGNVTADTISGASGGDGITQSTGIAISNQDAYIFSVWLKSTSGTPSVDLVLRDDAAQVTTATVDLSTTWMRYEVYRKFTAAPVGDVNVDILVGNTNTVRAWGAQLDEVAGPSGHAVGWKWGGLNNYGPYIPTTSAAAAQSQDELYYSGSEITVARSKCTMVVWFFRPTFTDLLWGDCIFVSLSSNTLGVQMAVKMSSSSYTLQVEYGGGSGFVDTTSAGVGSQFNQVIISSDMDSDNYATYVNGASVQTNTTARAPLASNDWLNIGHQYASDSGNLAARTIIGRVELYAAALDSTQAAALYTAQKGVYGL